MAPALPPGGQDGAEHPLGFAVDGLGAVEADETVAEQHNQTLPSCRLNAAERTPRRRAQLLMASGRHRRSATDSSLTAQKANAGRS
jgi:hypothetical protein